MPSEKKIIFLNSYSPRTGHNFVSEAIKVFSQHEVLIHNRSETRLSRMLEAYYHIYYKSIHHKTDKDFMDHLFIHSLRSRILEKCDNEYAMIKDTTLIGKDHLRKLFPEDIHFILLRDPNAVFNSLMKAMKFKKPGFKTIVKKIGIQLGIYPYYYSRKMSHRILRELPDFSHYEVIKYEDLHQKNLETIERLKTIFQCPKSMDQLLEEIDAIQVINSSFHEEVAARKIWEAKPKTETFDPIHRKGNSFFIRLGVRMGTQKLRQKLGYIS